MILGEMSNEFPDHEIVIFVAAGPKQYAIKTIHKTTKEESYVMKIRGITLNSENASKLHFSDFKEMVLNYEENKRVTMNYNSILPSKYGQIITKKTKRNYRVFFDKGIVLTPSLKIIPFGFNCKD